MTSDYCDSQFQSISLHFTLRKILQLSEGDVSNAKSNVSGKFMRKIGQIEVTSFPNGIDISDAGDVLIGDSHGNRFHVAIYKRTGEFETEFECPSIKVRPDNITWSPFGKKNKVKIVNHSIDLDEGVLNM